MSLRHQRPEGARRGDVDNNIARLDLYEGVLGELVQVADDVATLDHARHAASHQVEGGYTLQTDNDQTGTGHFTTTPTSCFMQILASEKSLLQ